RRSRCSHSACPLALRLPWSMQLVQIAQDGARGIGARSAHHTASRMSAGAAHVDAAHRRAVLRVPGYRAVEEQLIERELALKNVSLSKTDLVLDVPGRADFCVQNELFEIGAMPRDGVDDGGAEGFALLRGPLAI